MSPEDFSLYLLGSLADIRTALWSLVAVLGLVPVSVLVHALAVRPRKAPRK